MQIFCTMESFISRRTIARLRNAVKQSVFSRTQKRAAAQLTHSSATISSSQHFPKTDFCFLPSDKYLALKPNIISNIRPLHYLQGHQQYYPDEEDGPMNVFLERFVYVMRGRLSEAFPDTSKEVMDGMLEIIVDKVVTEMEKGTLDELKQYASHSSAELRDFSQELWATVLEVSQFILEDMRKAEIKREIQECLQSDEVKRISKLAMDIGLSGDRLRDFKVYWAEQKRSEMEFQRSLEQMVHEGPAKNLIESGAEGDESVQSAQSLEPEEKPSRVLQHRRGKLKHRVYGINMADPSWTEVGEKLVMAEKKIFPEEPALLSGKSKAITNQILSLSDDEDPSELLAQWVENVKPRRVDWLALLQQLNEPKRGLFFKATEFALNEESFEGNIRDYTKLLDAYAKQDSLEDAERVLQTMVEKGFVRDAVTCTILIHMYSKVGNLDRAREAFDEIRRLGLQPDQKAYSSMIMAYVKAGLPKAAESLMREMEAKDIKPGKEVYMALLRAFAHRGHVDGAQRIFNTMQFAGIMPNLESCTLLVEAYGQSGDPDQARNVFDHMMKAGHKPDDKCTSSMLAAYEKKNLLDKALSLMLDLEKDGFKPGVETTAILIDWLGKLGLVDEAEQLFDEIAGKEEVPSKVCVSLCDMYARAGLQQKAMDTLGIVESRTETLGTDGFERLIHGLLAGGLVDEAKRMHDRMQSQGLAPSEPVRVALMAAQAISRRKPISR